MICLTNQNLSIINRTISDVLSAYLWSNDSFSMNNDYKGKLNSVVFTNDLLSFYN